MGWLHRLLHPHCEHCNEDKICSSCEILKEQLRLVQFQNQQLMNSIMHPVVQDNKAPELQELPKPLMNKTVPWGTRKSMLEAEDRKAAQILKDKQKEMKATAGEQSVDDLEKELGVSNG